jgi:hypothetical protein
MKTSTKISISNALKTTTKLALIYLHKDYMAISHMMLPILDDFAFDFKEDLVIYLLESGKEPEFEKIVEITKYPTLLFYKGEKLMLKKDGLVNRKELKKSIKWLLNPPKKE